MNAGIALDPDLAVAQVLPDPVQPVACSLDTQLVGAARSQSERIADGHAMFGRLQFDPLDLRRRFACEEMRHQRGKIEPLVRPLAQPQHQRPHGNRSFKWK